MKIEFDADTFLRAIESYAEKKEKQIAEGLEKCCIKVQRSAFGKCPKDSNALRQSISYKVTKYTHKAQGIVGSELEYAPYVHEGTGIYSRTGRGRKDVPWSYKDEDGKWHLTSGIKPTPFLEEARNECKDEILQIMFDTLKG